MLMGGGGGGGGINTPETSCMCCNTDLPVENSAQHSFKSYSISDAISLHLSLDMETSRDRNGQILCQVHF